MLSRGWRQQWSFLTTATQGNTHKNQQKQIFHLKIIAVHGNKARNYTGGTTRNRLFPRAQRQHRTRILIYQQLNTVLYALLPCSHKKIMILGAALGLSNRMPGCSLPITANLKMTSGCHVACRLQCMKGVGERG